MKSSTVKAPEGIEPEKFDAERLDSAVQLLTLSPDKVRELRNAAESALQALVPGEKRRGEFLGVWCRCEETSVMELRYENLMRGYDGWYWAVALETRLGTPSVLEAYPLPSASALLIPSSPRTLRRIRTHQGASRPDLEFSEVTISALSDAGLIKGEQKDGSAGAAGSAGAEAGGQRRRRTRVVISTEVVAENPEGEALNAETVIADWELERNVDGVDFEETL